MNQFSSTIQKATMLLASSMALFTFYSTPTQAATTQCRGEIALQGGARMIYLVSGSLNASNGEQSNLRMTLLRRERDGKESVLRQNAPLSNFETDAPDADYSRLPFTGIFKAKPNNGRGIYHLQSAKHQLLIRMMPYQSAPQQAQVVHYLDQTRFVRSSGFSCKPKA